MKESRTMKFARLKPYNGKSHVLRSFTVFGIKFQEKNGWYQVEDDVAAYLKTCVQIQEDPHSHKAFDVVDSLEEAEEIDELEKKRAERAMAAEARPAKRVHSAAGKHAASGDLTTADLQKPPAGRREKGFDDMAETFDDDMAGKTKPVAPVLDGAEDEAEETDASSEDEDTSDEAPKTAAKPVVAPRGRGRGR